MSTGQLLERIEQLNEELLYAEAHVEELKTKNEQLEEQVWDLTHTEEEIQTTNH